jgi:hypothetical protein
VQARESEATRYFADADADADGLLWYDEAFDFAEKLRGAAPYATLRERLPSCMAPTAKPLDFARAQALSDCMWGDQVGFLFEGV